MGAQVKQIKLTESERREFTEEWNAAVDRVKGSKVDLNTIIIVVEAKEQENGKSV